MPVLMSPPAWSWPRIPESGADTCGYHRMQLKGPNKLGVSLHSRQRLWEYLRRAEQAGRNLEAAVVIGVHPAVSLGSMALVPYDQGKFACIGCLLKAPLQVTPCQDIGLEVPFFAEIVIEGEILAGRHEPEGPFAEFTNYASSRSTENIFRVKSIHYRDQALISEYHPGPVRRSCDHRRAPSGGGSVTSPLIKPCPTSSRSMPPFRLAVFSTVIFPWKKSPKASPRKPSWRPWP